jgi:hypothetical protein
VTNGPTDPISEQLAGHVLLSSHDHPISKTDQLEKHFLTFAANILSLNDEASKNPAGSPHLRPVAPIRNRLRRKLRRARGAESRRDFIHKLRVVFKELNETTIWLELIAQTSLLSSETIQPIVAEDRELCRIIAASIKTAASGEG